MVVVVYKEHVHLIYIGVFAIKISIVCQIFINVRVILANARYRCNMKVKYSVLYALMI